MGIDKTIFSITHCLTDTLEKVISYLIIYHRNNLLALLIDMVEIPDASTQATAAFFCMYPILLDLARSACFDLAPVYPSSHSEFTAYYDGNSVSQTYTVKKSFDWQNAGKVAQSYLRTFDPAPHASRLNDLAEAFTTDPFYNSAPIYFYQKTAAPFTKDDLAKTVTSANLRAILQRAAVTVSTIDKQ